MPDYMTIYIRHVCFLHACIFMGQHELHVLSVHACCRAHYQITAVCGVGGNVITAAAGKTVYPVQVAVAVLSLCSTGSCSLLSEGINLLFGLLYF